MAFMTAVGNVSLLLAKDSQPSIDERVAVFSDALNHASIIDGIRLAEKQKSVAAFVYRHCDMHHLNELLYVILHLVFYLRWMLFCSSFVYICVLTEQIAL